METLITRLSQAQPADIEMLLDAAFGPDRHQRTAYRIRAGVPVIDALSFAAFSQEELVGSIQCWPAAVAAAPVVLVGPVAVMPHRQREGIGRMLMTHLIEVAPTTPMAMIGDPEYYGRLFGFSAVATGDWEVPGPVERHRLLARNADSLPAAGILGPRAFALDDIAA